jgi:PAS domain S-box-containing protein
MLTKKIEFWLVLCAFINVLADKTLATYPDNYAAYYIILGCPLYYIMQINLQDKWE